MENQETKSIFELLNSNYGPIVNILRFLKKEDLRKLAFVCSSNIKQMIEKYKNLKQLGIMGRKLETVTFEPRYISFQHRIPAIVKFMDELALPINVLSQKQEEFLQDHGFLKNREYTFDKATTDLYNLDYAISIGEKISPSVIICFALMQKYRFVFIVRHMVKEYKDTNLVKSMLPKKCMALILSQDTHYLVVLAFYKLFGISYVKELIEMLDKNLYFKRLFHSYKIFTQRVENITADYEEYDNQYSIKSLTNIIKEGSNILKFTEELMEAYPEISLVENERKYRVKSNLDGVKWSMYDIKDLIETFHSNELK